MTDAETFEAFVRRYQDMVFATAVRLLGNPADAEDAAQTVFLRAFERYAQLAGNPAAGGWLKTTARNVCLNHLRGRRRHPEDEQDQLLLEIAAAGDDPESALSARSLLDRIFGREPESTRTMAVLHLVDGMTLEEVAHEVGLSVSGVRKRLRTLKARVAALEEV